MEVATLLLLSSQVGYTALAQEENMATATTSDLDVNFLTASFECSHRGKEWHVCTQPDGWGAMFYCPAYSEYNETQLQDVEWGSLGDPTPLKPCFTCPSADSNCSVFVTELLAANNISQDQNSTLGGLNIMDEAIRYCEDLCESNKEGEACSQDNQCTPGALFCEYSANDTEYAFGTCKRCPTQPDECSQEGFATSVQGQYNCRDCRLFCYGVGVSKVWIEGEPVLSQPIDSAIQASHQNASGPIHDCSKLILDPNNVCPGADGKICLVEFEEQVAIPWQVSRQAEQSGCAGILAFINNYDSLVSNSNSELRIPYIYIPMEEGKRILKNKIGATAKLEVEIFGAGCYPSWKSHMCSATRPCKKGSFCEFYSVPLENDLYSEGYCQPCPEDPVGCFFVPPSEDIWIDTSLTYSIQKVQSCTKSCEALIPSDGCKYCTSEVSPFNIHINLSQDDWCSFCPKGDIQYLDRIVPLFAGHQCSQLDEFYTNVPINKDSRNCQLAQSLNYICGCEGTGYAGATTTAQRRALAWLPRVAAILSILGSSFIIYDALRKATRRRKFLNQLLSTLSFFDIVGALAYSLTTLPAPESLYLYGGKGNLQTCRAQGFLIQIGTIACYLSVSLAMYYLLTIKHGWSDEMLKRKRVAYFLYIPPIAIGLGLAFAGIPFYDSVMVWCSNTAQWWPEVPLIISIVAATVIMGFVCFDVYKTERASSQYNGRRMGISKMVFKQALCFVAAFYVTFCPYLIMQYMWSSGRGYNNYSLVLIGATLVPLQGFWNCIVYCRPRYLNDRTNTSTILTLIRIPANILLSFVRRDSKQSNFKKSNPESTRRSILHQHPSTDSAVNRDPANNDLDFENSPR